MLGCSSCPVICASSTKLRFLGRIGLIEQILDGHFAADVAIDGAENGAHAAARDFAGEHVAFAVSRAAGQQLPHRRPAVLVRFTVGAAGSEGDARIDAGAGQTAELAVDALGRHEGDGAIGLRHDEGPATGRTGGLPSGELVLDRELHAAGDAGKSDHDDLGTASARTVLAEEGHGVVMFRLFHTPERN